MFPFGGGGNFGLFSGGELLLVSGTVTMDSQKKQERTNGGKQCNPVSPVFNGGSINMIVKMMVVFFESAVCDIP